MTPGGVDARTAAREGARIAAARREAGLTQRDLAVELDVSLWVIERLEAGGGTRAGAPADAGVALGLSEPPAGAAGPPSAEGPAEAAGPPSAESLAGDRRPWAGKPGLRGRLRALGGSPRVAALAPGGEPLAANAAPAAAENPVPAAKPGRSGHAAAAGESDRVRAALEARVASGLSKREAAERLGLSLWELERLERKTLPAPALAGVKRVRRVPRSVDSLPQALVLGTVAALVLIRFFTEVIGVLPRALNFVDVPLFGLLVLAAAARRVSATDAREAERYVPAALLFVVICAVATLANPSRVDLGPVLVFIYGFAAPLGAYWAAYRLWPTGQALNMSRLIVALGLTQIVVVVLIDLPRFLATDNPDEVSGTFGTNAYQLVFFLLAFAAVLAGIFTFEQGRRVAPFVPALFVAVLGIVFLAQFRALIFTTAVTLAALTAILGSARLRGLVAGVFVGAAFLVTLSYTAGAFPILKLAPTVDTLQQNPISFVSERVRGATGFTELFGDDPRYIATGTGPGTYSSRAWQTFSYAGSRSESNVQGKYVKALTGDSIYRTDVSDKYVTPQVREGRSIQGSKALTSPFSSYGSLLAEVGLLGFLVMVGIYVRALAQAIRMTFVTRRQAHRGDPVPALVLGSAAALFVLLQMGFLENWLEVTRLSFPTWILLAVATKEFRHRYEADRI